jgi:hypothetical protein
MQTLRAQKRPVTAFSTCSPRGSAAQRRSVVCAVTWLGQLSKLPFAILRPNDFNVTCSASPRLRRTAREWKRLTLGGMPTVAGLERNATKPQMAGQRKTDVDFPQRDPCTRPQQRSEKASASAYYDHDPVCAMVRWWEAVLSCHRAGQEDGHAAGLGKRLLVTRCGRTESRS